MKKDEEVELEAGDGIGTREWSENRREEGLLDSNGKEEECGDIGWVVVVEHRKDGHQR